MNPLQGPTGVGGSPHSSAAPTPGGRRDPTSGSVRQCANVTFGFMTLFLSSKCHGKCQTEAEDGEEPTKEGVRCWGWSGTNGGLWPGWDSSPPPKSPLGLLGLSAMSSLCPSRCDLVEMLP